MRKLLLALLTASTILTSASVVNAGRVTCSGCIVAPRPGEKRGGPLKRQWNFRLYNRDHTDKITFYIEGRKYTVRPGSDQLIEFKTSKDTVKIVFDLYTRSGAFEPYTIEYKVDSGLDIKLWYDNDTNQLKGGYKDL